MKLVKVAVKVNDFKTNNATDGFITTSTTLQKIKLEYFYMQQNSYLSCCVLPPRPPPLNIVCNLLLCSPCSVSVPSFHEQDSTFTIHSRTQTPMGGSVNSGSQQQKESKTIAF